jgi:transposase InsO family protein
MQLAGISVRKRRTYKVTTQSKHYYPAAPNIIERCFQTERPNMIWVSDITYIKTREGWLYLAVIMDLYSRKIVGWSLARNMAVALVREALMMATGRRQPGPGLIHHSDRGIQYACDEYRRLLQLHDMVSSMSRSGNFHTLKKECLQNWRDMSAGEVKHDIVDYIEMFYNSQRLHSFNGYISPKDFERVPISLNGLSVFT